MENKESGDYIGYTESVENYGYPTLYFEDGRLTQKHKKIDNIGWHHHKSGHRIIRFNITGNEYSEYRRVRKEEKAGGKKRKNLSFIKKMIEGKYVESQDSSRLLEITLDDKGSIRSFHPSRSKLIRRKGSEFNTSYGNVYARNQLKFARPAINSKESGFKISYSPNKYK